MANNMYSKETYRSLYDLINTDGDLYDIYKTLHYMLSDLDESLANKVVNQCTQIVAVYEYVQSLECYGDCWELFIEKLESCNYNRENFIDPLRYAKLCSFKLKCIVTIQEIVNNNFITMEEAVYKTCSSEKYIALEEAIINAKKGESRSKDKHKLFGLIMSMLLVSPIFPVGIIFGIADGISYTVTPKVCGKVSLLRDYNKTRKALNDRNPKYETDTCVDYSQEYFDPTYVNM
ncbi:MAG: hypothetical protein IKK85_04410 [Clostridia bacterium]|nr:hypothetical protein [Clostridia bacterium]